MGNLLQVRRYSPVTVSRFSSLVPKSPSRKTSRRHAICVPHFPVPAFSSPLRELLPPFAPWTPLLATPSPQVSACGLPGFTLRSVTRLLWPGLHHYYGFICHPTCHALSARIASCQISLKGMPLERRYRASPVNTQLPVRYAVLIHYIRYDQVSGFALPSTLTSPA